MSDAPSNTPNRPQDWKAANRKLVTLPSGNTVRIRRLTGEFVLVLAGLFEGLPQVKDEATGTLTYKIPLARQREYLRALILESVIEPKVVPDSVPAGDDAMYMADFGRDLDPLIKEIQDWNQEVLRPDSFRDQAPDGGAAAPAGEALPPDAGAAPAGAAG